MTTEPDIIHNKGADSGERLERWGDYQALSYGDAPPRYLFLHANGFNGGTYRSLLHRFADKGGWAAPDFRGHGGSFQPDKIHNWLDFVSDIRAWQSQGRFERPIAIGHSLGGMAALMAEARDPGAFDGIVLLDPVIFPPRFVALMVAANLVGLWRRNPLAKGARARRAVFSSRAEIIESYRPKRAFRAWEMSFLNDYATFGFKDTADGVKLACPGQIEAQIFSSWPARFWFEVGRVGCPVLILRGSRSDTFWDETARRLERKLPRATRMEIEESGHFLPMEQPDKVAKAIRDWERATYDYAIL